MPDTAVEPKCTKLVGSGVIQYPCTLKVHDGPCVAVEVPSSKVRREQWLRDIIANGTIESPPTPEAPPAPSVTPPSAEPTPSQISDRQVDVDPHDDTPQSAPRFSPHSQRLEMALSSLTKPYDELPQAVRSWALGAIAQLSLIELWRTWQKHPDQTITLTAEDIEALIPDALRQ